ncbi:3'-5' exonuclease [Streptomyces ovatisporus]|uniref:3'-5' exonuclease n=1 Tax=Streptomyces ovatisporus TaxID=1128682 RepID=A0ABV9A6F6_9ACTN
MTPWYEGPLASLTVRARQPDRPQPGAEVLPDPERDVLTAAALVMQQAPHAPVEVHSWPSLPDSPAGPVVEALSRSLAEAAAWPLTVAHAPYDLTLLDRELRRHRRRSLTACLGHRSLCVLDPVLLDRRLNRAADPARRGLLDLCEDYGVQLPHRPDSRPLADCLSAPEPAAVATLELVRALGRRYAPQLAGLTPPALHALQAVWYAAEARGSATWFAPCPQAKTYPAWPLRPVIAA